jgi:hypothetical protein
MAKIDFGMSENGDFVLGSPKFDSNGNVLYIYKDGTITTDYQRGDEKGRFIRDLVYVYDNNRYKQIINNRLKTDAPDWFHHPLMGGNLTDLIGEPNTSETGDRGVLYIRQALTYDGLLGEQDLTVRAVPVNPEEIMFLITIGSSDNQPYRYPIILNLNHGLREV